GDIIVDDSKFDAVRFDPGRSEQRVDRAYDAPIGALSFNWNSVNVYVRGPSKDADRANVFLDPENSYVELDNKTKIGGRELNVNVSRVLEKGKEKVIVSGTVPKDFGEKVFYKGITEPEIWAGENLKSFLSQRGIEVLGKIRKGVSPSNAKVVAFSEGATIQELVTMMMKFSNNFVAEMLTKCLGSLSKESRVSLSDGIHYIEKKIKKMGLDPGDFDISSVSGLSQKNRFKAASLWKFQRSLFQDFEFSADYVSALPISGRDGTLKSRLKGNGTDGKIKAKTGLLSGVVSLSGFYENEKNEVNSFVFFYNGKSEPWKVQKFFDDVLANLVRN
ncbi:MAG: D-alanyl-D-alanine carboxypeptidase/D-alanyl-D-alanine-endopeptidase, partial [Bdellovibrionales bacterium]|nr:D-alanyl-D-alanine carboxypeptidase/D-alanyl-D-alanine-endopeptidase [Bdellovibrionales bacterium]